MFQLLTELRVELFSYPVLCGRDMRALAALSILIRRSRLNASPRRSDRATPAENDTCCEASSTKGGIPLECVRESLVFMDLWNARKPAC